MLPDINRYVQTVLNIGSWFDLNNGTFKVMVKTFFKDKFKDLLLGRWDR